MAALPPNLLPSATSPDWMNKADNAWQLTAATLVGLQSVPGLIILYGGAVKKKWAVNSAFMALYAFASVLFCWVLWGYRMSFGDRLVGFWGRAGAALDENYLFAQAYSGMFPNATMVYFQFAFAAITLILIAGAVLGRMNFYAWMLFVPLWLTFSYTFTAFSIWSPKGFFFKMGIIDFAGGFVIHLASGVAGFTAAYWVGPRLNKDRERFPPNNILLMLAGAGLLWLGWTGFNGGAPVAANLDTALAILNTHVCTAASLLTWVILDVLFFRKPSVIGAVQGMTTGLVCITPAAGVVQGWAALLMGIFSGSLPWVTMMVIHKRSKLLQKVDDTMAILHTHAIAGSLGGICAGLFAVPKLNGMFFPAYDQYIGFFYSLQMKDPKTGLRQLGIQCLGILFVVIINVVVTSLICLAIRLIVPLRMSEEDMEIGDEAAHGEEAYAIWGQGDKLENSVSKYNGNSHYEDAEGGTKKKKTAGQVEMMA